MLLSIFILTVGLVIFSIFKYKILTNPFVLEVQYTLLFLIVPQLILVFIGLGEEFALSNWVILVYVISVFAGTQINIKPIKLSEIKKGKATAFISLIVAAILILPTLTILFECGLSIGGLRCYYESVVFSKFASFYDLGKTFLLFSIILFLLEYKRVTWWLIILILIMIFSGSKFAIFNLLIFIGIYLEIYKKVKLRTIFIACVPIMLLMITYHFIQSKNIENPFLAALSYFDIYEKQSFLLEKFQSGAHDLYYGEIGFSSYYKFIPRIFWENKPYDYGFAILNYEFLPEFAAANYMPSFGLGTIYADFGMISIILSGLVSGFLRKYCFRIFEESKYNNTSLILYYFSVSILTFQYLIVLVIFSYIFKQGKYEQADN